jgi:DNA-binding MarR family transcriptional regulator
MSPPVDAPHPGFDLEEFLPYRLSVLSNRVSDAFARLYETRFGITIPEWRVIANVGRFGPISANGVCEHSAMDKVTVSRAVQRLVDKGHLDRRTDAHDRRRSSLTLSPQGAAIYAEIVPLALRIQAALVADMDEAERRALDSLMDKLDQQIAKLP